MKSVILPLALALAAPFLCGCADARIRVTTISASGQSQPAQELTETEINMYSSCGLRACMLGPKHNGFKGNIQNTIFNEMSRAFASVVLAEDMGGGRNCDIGLKFLNIMAGDSVDVYSAYTKEKLAHVDAYFNRVPRVVCRILDPDAPLGAKLAAQRGSAPVPPAPTLARARSREQPRLGLLGARSDATEPAAPVDAGVQPAPAQPAAAPGLSSVDIERIAKAVRNTNAPAPGAPSVLAETAVPRFSAPERPDDLAVIIGIESYSDIASKASYAERDADAFKAHVRALGVPERNIVLLKGSKAGKASFEKNVEVWLPRLVKADSRVYFFFSGHGAPDVKTGQAYLVPWDGDPSFLESTAYPVAKLSRKLGALPAKQVLVAMDSCFSGAGGRSVLASGARPLVGKIETGAVPAKLTVLAASAANEISGSLDDKGHGAFTWFLLEGLNAGKTTPKALSEYLTPRVQDEAKRLNRDQTPQLQGDGSWSLR